MNDTGVKPNNSEAFSVNLRVSSGSPGSIGAAKRPGFIYLVFGVIFPFSVICLELATNMCAQDFFDPVPDVWHILLVGAVPGANLLLWLVLRDLVRVGPRWLGVANGLAIGVASYYTALFMPLYPLALIAMIWLIGILPMAPLFSLIAAGRGYRCLKSRMASDGLSPARTVLAGVLISVIAIVAAEAPATITRIAMQYLAAEPAGTQSTLALRVLRTIGNDDILLRSCYQRAGRAGDLLSVALALGKPIQPDQARQIYYRVKGVPFNSVTPPSYIAKQRFLSDTFEADWDQAGDSVAGRVKGLRLDASRLDASVDPDAVVAYVEWTLVFRNDSGLQREARAQVALPPGAVVSRVTLWVNGEEREAAFASRARVKEAYQKIVKRQRDPLLVTTSGPDAILVQCFPVPPNGGEMKVRLGMTAPLVMEGREGVSLRLPLFLERNFAVSAQMKRHVWIESHGRLTSSLSGLVEEQATEGVYALRGEISEGAFTGSVPAIRAERSPQVTSAWSDDPSGTDGKAVLQSIGEAQLRRPTGLVVVIDGSRALAPQSKDISEALLSLPREVSLRVLVASDQVIDLTPDPVRATPDAVAAISRQLAAVSFRGGCDNVPALAQALDAALKTPGSAVLWIHGPQPVEIESTERLAQLFQRRSSSAKLYTFGTLTGRNVIAEKLERHGVVKAVPRIGSFRTDLERFLQHLGSETVEITAVRTRAERPTEEPSSGTKKTSDHLARLWAHDTIVRLSASGKDAQVREASELAARYHLVTPVSGAVVLENAAQYQEAGLTPADSTSVPTIPEPETWALIAMVLAAILWVMKKRRPSWTAA